MRGKVAVQKFYQRYRGITPAYAGKSRISPGFLLSYRDHPRVCGEKYSPLIGRVRHVGSPPRMRGKEDSADESKSNKRDHPRVCGEKHSQRAYCISYWDHPRVCGEKRDFSRHPPFLQDHPRVCGEKMMVRPCLRLKSGSPPRMRGKGQTRCEVIMEFGITPAYAGKRLKKIP